jgi:hypothetical protein
MCYEPYQYDIIPDEPIRINSIDELSLENIVSKYLSALSREHRVKGTHQGIFPVIQTIIG